MCKILYCRWVLMYFPCLVAPSWNHRRSGMRWATTHCEHIRPGSFPSSGHCRSGCDEPPLLVNIPPRSVNIPLQSVSTTPWSVNTPPQSVHIFPWSVPSWSCWSSRCDRPPLPVNIPPWSVNTPPQSVKTPPQSVNIPPWSCPQLESLRKWMWLETTHCLHTCMIY